MPGGEPSEGAVGHGAHGVGPGRRWEGFDGGMNIVCVCRVCLVFYFFCFFVIRIK